MLASISSILRGDEASFYELLSPIGTINMISLYSHDALQKGANILIGIRPLDVAISLSPISDSSITNCIFCKIDDIKIDYVLCSLRLDFGLNIQLESVISAMSAKKLNLKVGDEVYAIFKATSVFIRSVV